MSYSISLSIEERFLISIFFTEKKIDITEFRKLDYKLLVKITSSHLMLPALYINLKKKNCLNYLPEDFKNYIKEIYNLNKQRNEVLIEEVNEISKILKSKNIDYVFLKGSANIISEIYNNIGERMIGDIDILVNKNKLINSIKALQKHNYKDIKYSFFEKRHYTRQIKTNKIFAVEVHKNLLKRNSRILFTEDIIKNKIIFKKEFVPNFEDQLKHNIYNYQINDYGKLKLSYSLRNYYDTYLLEKINKINYKNLKVDSYLNDYIMIARELGIPIFENININRSNIRPFIFKIKKENKLFRMIFDKIIKLLLFKVRIRQLYEFLVNKKYREYIFMKLKNK